MRTRGGGGSVTTRVRVRLTFKNREVHFHDAVSARLDGAELVIVTEQRTLRIATAELDEWSVKNVAGEWERSPEVAAR